MNCNTQISKILLSTAIAKEKNTTFDYGMAQLSSLDELMHTMNRKAVAPGIFMGGHRGGSYLKAMGNVYFIDIDTAPQTDEAPYYQTIEAKLKTLNISFVSVPSKSAYQYPYKRHIAIVLDGNLPKQGGLFTDTANYILKTIGIDVKKDGNQISGVDVNRIDLKVAFDRSRFLTPACINKHFSNYDDMSSFYDGSALPMPKHLKAIYDDANCDKEITTEELITFTDGTVTSVHDAKKIVVKGSHKPCHCPNPHHEDKHPSAAFFHNDDGTVVIYCQSDGCGTINITTNFISVIPIITHDQYNYSIILNNTPQAKISTLVSKIGNYSYRTDTSVIWTYSVLGMDDIYQLLLAKAYLVQNGFEVSHEPAPQKYLSLLSTATLQPITKNITLPKAFIPQGEVSQYDAMYFRVKSLVRKHYLFPETTIHAYHQNVLAPDRPFTDTCNKGLAYFDHVIKTQHDQLGYKQSDKYFPMNLDAKAKAASNKKRLNKSNRTIQMKMTVNEKKVLRLLNDKKFVKSNGKPNVMAIAKRLNKSRDAIYRYVKAIEAVE